MLMNMNKWGGKFFCMFDVIRWLVLMISVGGVTSACTGYPDIPAPPCLY